MAMVRASFIIFLFLAGADAQYGRGGPDHKGNDLDVNLDEPGEHDDDGLTLSSIPQTSFTCAGREPGYYADFETNCQVFRVCTLGSRTGFQSFICPSGTLFNQNVFVCDWASNVKCDKSKEVFTQERFGNLKLGPQIMQDVNKMLTHTMRVSYDENSAQINTLPQENKPPIEQASLNEISAAAPGYEQGPSNTYIPPQQAQNTFSNDVAFSASTASPQYTYNNPNSIQSVPKEPLKSNGRTGRFNNRAFQNNGLPQHTHTNRNRANQRNAFDRRRGRLIQNNPNSNTNTNSNGYPRISGNLKGDLSNKVKDNVVSRLTSSQNSGNNNNGYNYNNPSQRGGNSQRTETSSYTKNTSTNQGNSQQNAPEEYKLDDRNAKLSQQTNTNGDTTVQFVPSVSFEVEDEKEQENIFNIFKIDTSFTNNTQVSNDDQASNGYPKETPSSPGKALEAESLPEQSTTPKASEEQGSPNTLYAGPSSYSAPQASVGNLEAKQEGEEKKSTSAPEQPSSGYAKRSLIHIYSF